MCENAGADWITRVRDRQRERKRDWCEGQRTNTESNWMSERIEMVVDALAKSWCKFCGSQFANQNKKLKMKLKIKSVSEQ